MHLEAVQIFEQWASVASSWAVTALFALACWLALRATGAIIGEYAKRIWFRRVWKDEVQKANAKLAILEQAIAAERAEYSQVSKLAERLLLENNKLKWEMLMLKGDLASAPAHQGKPVRPLPSSPPSFAGCEGGSEESELSLARPSIYLR